MKECYLAGGCFWCIASKFYEMNGIKDVISGFSGGEEINPTYEDVKKQLTKHRETIKIIYDDKCLNYSDILKVYVASVDPYDGDGQFIDRGESYTLAIYYNNEEEYNIAHELIKELEKVSGKKVCITVEKFKTFYDATEYHQKFSIKNKDKFQMELDESGRNNYDFIENILVSNSEKEYGEFVAKLNPNVDSRRFLGVRVPIVRDIAKFVKKNGMDKDFMEKLPHKYYDEDMLHGSLISMIKNVTEAINEVNKFLPYIDNWSICDTTNPKCFKKYNEEVIDNIYKWLDSSETYTIRFGISILMSFYLDELYDIKYSDRVAKIRSEEYYVNMMIAWYFATLLSKHWDEGIKYLLNNELSVWVHNKTIRKAIESYRITDSQKEYLRGLKR